MGVLKQYFNQTRKPSGRLGSLMIANMNLGHARLADWGMQQLPEASPKQILEIGCGGGRNVTRLLQTFPEARLTAIDYSPLSVQKTEARNRALVQAGRCTVLEADVSALPFPTSSFDLATAFETIYFWPGLTECFTQAAKVLKPGGIFLIVNESDGTDPASRSFENIIEGMKLYTEEQISEALRKAGFSSVQAFHHPSKSWLTVIGRK